MIGLRSKAPVEQVSLGEGKTAGAKRKGGSAPAVDLLATVVGTAVAAMAGAQFLFPWAASPLTGFEPGLATDVLALIWGLLGVLLLMAATMRLRVLTIFAAEFLFMIGAAAAVVIFFRDPGSVALMTHAAVAGLAFASSGVARLADKAELRRELRLVREQANRPLSQDDGPLPSGDRPDPTA